MQNYEYDTLCANRINEYPGLVVICAGNYNRDIDIRPCYPASYGFDNIIAVGNSTKDDEKNPSSNYGEQTVDLFAPGTDIYSTVIGGDYDFDTGTSMSAPHVAGTAALLLSYNPNLTTSELKEAILESVDPIDALSGYCSTGGRLNTYNALRYIYDDYAVVVNDYEQLKEALAGSATKIRIAQDITMVGTLTISRSVSITPYGTESVTLTAADGKRHFLTNGNITIDLTGITLYGGGIETYGTLTLNGGKITGSTSFTEGGGIDNFGNLTINSGEISGNTATDGGGIYNSRSVQTINGGEISNNTAKYWGGGIYSHTGATLTIYSGKISNNTAGSYGGGIDNNNDGKLTIYDGEISGNKAIEGGGIYNRGGTEVTINGGKISANTSSSWGGGIFNDTNTTLTINGGEVSGNIASNGGGIFNQNVTMTIYDGKISNNAASGQCGGISGGGTLTIYGGEISGNKALFGSGIYSGGTLTIYSGEICGNIAKNIGGGIYNARMLPVTINGGKISGNTAGLWGGGINNDGILTIYDGEISNNTAVGGGGGIENSYGTLTINGGKISNNSATGDSVVVPYGAGGGIDNYKGLVIITEGEISNNAAAVHGGGVYNSEESEVMISGGTIFDNTPDDTYGF